LSLPAFPDKPEGYTVEDSIAQILTSIAMEEIGLSHIINAEGEKIQYLLGTLPGSGAYAPTVGELLTVNESVRDTLNAVTANQMFLYGKMMSALNAYYKNQTAPGPAPAPPPDCELPTAVSGRRLSAEQTGDIAGWVEIAQCGGYSLILRRNFLDLFAQAGQSGNAPYQYTAFGANGNYLGSVARDKLNRWFDGTAEGAADKLPASARLRNYTVRNTALSALGTGAASEQGVTDGFSKPLAAHDPDGADTAFALSFSEAAAFASRSYQWDGATPAQSTQAAQNNFAALDIPGGEEAYNRLWLRSGGSDPAMASSLDYNGRVNQTAAQGDEYGLLYPALWVDSALFEL
jgi:hypothetical protein